ncbi:hypothetical protein GTQ40_08960 [Flavobacteriaceae bacterium R38]|nr:hypothetical protein [Flavobacteriaceae bacterium R38]
MKNQRTIICVFFIFITSYLAAQKSPDLTAHSFEVDDLKEERFVSFTKKQLENSQFALVGEQHGIKEAGIFTNAIFNLAQDYGYKNLCIETDALAAKKIAEMAASGNALTEAKKVYNEFPFAIPFYNNEDDYIMFKNVKRKGGNIWGIDQTFMAQFGMNFKHIINTTSSKKLKNTLLPLKEKTIENYKNAIETKDFSNMYIFKYDKATHKALLSLSTNEEEKEIFHQLWKTKEIYGYNSTKAYYKNNNTRGQLMKSNFIKYYKEAQKKEALPKVIFKLGANHAARGLTRTNIYDIANFASELAIFNNQHSIHYMIAGITGETLTGNPFSPTPVAPFDNTKQLPKEIQEMVPSFTKKYFILDLASLREFAYGKRYSEALKKMIFNYDVLVLVKNAEALNSF